MSYQLVKEVIEKLEAFESSGSGTDLRSFSYWLYSQYQEAPSKGLPNLEENLDGLLTSLITTLNVHAKHYTKTALRGTPLVSMIDFGFLASLVENESLRKTELIARNYSELSPGIEVIKRLIRQELIEDFDDPEDGRSKRVRITRKGRELYLSALEGINKAAHLLCGDLEEEEKLHLLALLRKLNAFHQPIWDQERGKDLEELENRLNG
jgi:DNA-binding MarR family transcriptional regulator